MRENIRYGKRVHLDLACHDCSLYGLGARVLVLCSHIMELTICLPRQVKMGIDSTSHR